MQATHKHVFGTRDPHTPMDKDCNGHFLFWWCFIPINSWLHKQIPSHEKLTSTAQHVTGQMRLVFSEHGWPETIISVNGPCYSDETFTKLMKDYSANHIKSSPHYPQSNGLAEKYVQIVKNIFYKAQEEGTDLYKSLMIYRNTPLSSHLQSPMQILQSWTARSQLPMFNTARKQFGLEKNNLE